ncbi:MAG: 5/3-nucleotidase SurE [Cyanobacteriota bacterium]|jgi:5'-nucleotidase
MKLLVSNDDGIFAPGVQALANRLAQAGHQVSVVCPDRERSAVGHGLTLHHPIRANPVEGLFDPAVKAWSCSGTPADCVKLALWCLLDEKPDWVISGINQGANLGTDVIYSGTVSAAMEGLVEGVPSIAVSLTSFTVRDFQPAADYAAQLVAQLQAQPLDEMILLNVNVPPVPTAAIAGVKLARQGLRRYVEVFEKREDPRGKTYYWLAGEVVEEVEDPTPDHALPTDVAAIRENFITITPLQYNLTAFGRVDRLQSWLKSS